MKALPHLWAEYQRLLSEDPKLFQDIKQAEPTIAMTAQSQMPPSLTPSQAVKDDTFPLLPQNANQPVLAQAISQVEWLMGAINDIGFATIFAVLQVAKVDTTKMFEVMAPFKDKDVFVKHILDHSVALVQSRWRCN